MIALWIIGVLLALIVLLCWNRVGVHAVFGDELLLDARIGVFHTHILPGKEPDKEKKKRTKKTKEAKKAEEKEDPEAEVVVAGTDVYKAYIGKRVRHKSVGYGIVRTCDGKYLGIEFEEGPKAGKVTNYSLEACLSRGLIEIV